MFLSATEAAQLLNISAQRMRYLLQEDRVQGARKLHQVWVVPTFEDGLPRITKGKRGPDPSWKGKTGNPASINTVHINIDHLKENQENNNTDKTVLSVERNGINIVAGYTAEVHGPCQLVYRPDKPHPSGATFWIETIAPVTVGSLETEETPETEETEETVGDRDVKKN